MGGHLNTVCSLFVKIIAKDGFKLGLSVKLGWANLNPICKLDHIPAVLCALCVNMSAALAE